MKAWFESVVIVPSHLRRRDARAAEWDGGEYSAIGGDVAVAIGARLAHNVALDSADRTALASFAAVYADRNEKDHAALKKAIKAGTVAAQYEDEK
jgi:hypothetical protein